MGKGKGVKVENDKAEVGEGEMEELQSPSLQQ